MTVVKQHHPQAEMAAADLGLARLLSRFATPVAELRPDLPNLCSRIIKGEITVTWPYNSVTETFSFLVAEPDVLLRRVKGQVRIQLRGSIAKPVADCGIGPGDRVLIGLNGAELLEDELACRNPEARLDWKLQFTDKISIQVTLSDTNNVKTLILDHPEPEPEPEPEPTFEAVQEECEALQSSMVAPGEGKASVQVAPDFLQDEYPSPAFIKRARTSYGALFAEGFDGLGDDGDTGGKGRKRPRFSYGARVWRYSSKTPSPEAELQVEGGMGDVVEDSSEANRPQELQQAPPPRPQMIDEGCQTTLDLDDLDIAMLFRTPIQAGAGDVPREVVASPSQKATERQDSPQVLRSEEEDKDSRSQEQEATKARYQDTIESGHALPRLTAPLAKAARAMPHGSGPGPETAKPISGALSMFGTIPSVPVNADVSIADQVRFNISHIPQKPHNPQQFAAPEPVAKREMAAYPDQHSYVNAVQPDEPKYGREEKEAGITTRPRTESFQSETWPTHTRHLSYSAPLDDIQLDPELLQDRSGSAVVRVDIGPKDVPAGCSSYGTIQDVPVHSLGCLPTRDGHSPASGDTYPHPEDADAAMVYGSEDAEDDHDSQGADDFDLRGYEEPSEEEEGLSEEEVANADLDARYAEESLMDDYSDEGHEGFQGDVEGEVSDEDEYDGLQGFEHETLCQDSPLRQCGWMNRPSPPVPAEPVFINLLSESENEDRIPTPPSAPLRERPSANVADEAALQRPGHGSGALAATGRHGAATVRLPTRTGGIRESRKTSCPSRKGDRLSNKAQAGNGLNDESEAGGNDYSESEERLDLKERAGGGLTPDYATDSAFKDERGGYEDEDDSNEGSNQSEVDESSDRDSISIRSELDEDKSWVESSREERMQVESVDSGLESADFADASGEDLEAGEARRDALGPGPTASPSYATSTQSDQKTMLISSDTKTADCRTMQETASDQARAKRDCATRALPPTERVEEDMAESRASQRRVLLPDSNKEDGSARDTGPCAHRLTEAMATPLPAVPVPYFDHVVRQEVTQTRLVMEEVMGEELVRNERVRERERMGGEEFMGDSHLDTASREPVEEASIPVERHDREAEECADSLFGDGFEVKAGLGRGQGQGEGQDYALAPQLDGFKTQGEAADAGDSGPVDHQVMSESETSMDLNESVPSFEPVAGTILAPNAEDEKEAKREEEQCADIEMGEAPAQPEYEKARDCDPAQSDDDDRDDDTDDDDDDKDDVSMASPSQQLWWDMEEAETSHPADQGAAEAEARASSSSFHRFPTDEEVGQERMMKGDSTRTCQDQWSQDGIRAKAAELDEEAPSPPSSSVSMGAGVDPVAIDLIEAEALTVPDHDMVPHKSIKEDDVQEVEASSSAEVVVVLDSKAPAACLEDVEDGAAKEGDDKLTLAHTEIEPEEVVRRDGSGPSEGVLALESAPAGSPTWVTEDSTTKPDEEEEGSRLAHECTEADDVQGSDHSSPSEIVVILESGRPASSCQHGKGIPVAIAAAEERITAELDEDQMSARSPSPPATAEESARSRDMSQDRGFQSSQQALAAKRNRKLAPSRASNMRTRSVTTRAGSAQLSAQSEVEAEDDDHQDGSSSRANESVPLTARSHAEGDSSPSPNKTELIKRLHTNHQDCVTLKDLKQCVDSQANVVAIVTNAPSDPRRAKGSREYMMSFLVTDAATAPNVVVEVQLYRPHKDSLPVVKSGDVILLQAFTVKAQAKKCFALRTHDTSAWAVFEADHEADSLPQIRGAPVEEWNKYADYAAKLRNWYAALSHKDRDKVQNANRRLADGSRG